MTRTVVWIVLIGFLLSSCGVFNAAPNIDSITDSQIATSVAGTEQALAVSNPPEITETVDNNVVTEPDTLLPHSLYFLSSPDGENYQVWLLHKDGKTITRVTNEPDGVDEYAVSLTDGRVAYITANQLYTIAPGDEQPTLLIDGKDDINETEKYFYTKKLSGLSWSPDGSSLAYGRNGLHLYHFDTLVDEQIVANELENLDSGLLFPRALYSPNQWSPDGSKLLVNISYYEAGTLGVYSIGNPEILKLGEGIVCCQPVWSPDGRSVVIASPFLGYVDSGMWRLDAETGAQTELIPATSPDDTLNFAGWPVILPSGDLRYFFTNTPSFPSGDVALLLVTSAADGVSGRTILRPEQWLNYEALWAEDGALAVAVQPVTGEAAGWPRTGPIVLIPPTEDPVVPLGINGFQLQWGP